MVGRLDIASTALAGMSFATQLSFLLMVLMIGLTVGSVAFVARAHAHGLAVPGHCDRPTRLSWGSWQRSVTMIVLVAFVAHAYAKEMATQRHYDHSSRFRSLVLLRSVTSIFLFAFVAEAHAEFWCGLLSCMGIFSS